MSINWNRMHYECFDLVINSIIKLA